MDERTTEADVEGGDWHSEHLVVRIDLNRRAANPRSSSAQAGAAAAGIRARAPPTSAFAAIFATVSLPSARSDPTSICPTALAQKCPGSGIFEHASVLVVMGGRQVQIFEGISPIPWRLMMDRMAEEAKPGAPPQAAARGIENRDFAPSVTARGRIPPAGTDNVRSGRC